MINLDLLDRAIEDTPGDVVAVGKEQLRQFLKEMRLGQRARTALVNIRTQANLIPDWQV